MYIYIYRQTHTHINPHQISPLSQLTCHLSTPHQNSIFSTSFLTLSHLPSQPPTQIIIITLKNPISSAYASCHLFFFSSGIWPDNKLPVMVAMVCWLVLVCSCLCLSYIFPFSLLPLSSLVFFFFSTFFFG